MQDRVRSQRLDFTQPIQAILWDREATLIMGCTPEKEADGGALAALLIFINPPGQ